MAIYKTNRIRDLDKALKQDFNGFTFGYYEGYELRSAFQPVVSLTANHSPALLNPLSPVNLLGYEALVRPYHNNISITPDVFFASIPKKDRLFVEQLCCLLHISNASRLDLNKTLLFININPSAYNNRADVKPWVELFVSHMAYNGLDARNLVCETMERPTMNDKTMRLVIECFRDMGTKIAIDDFGINCSNFDRLLSFKPDMVKIDHFYLGGSRQNPGIKKLFQNIAKMLHEFHFELIIEGIETFEDLELSKELQAHHGQGFFIGHPSERPDLEPDCIVALNAEYARIEVQETSQIRLV